MLTNEADVGDPRGLVDEQREIIGPPAGKPHTTWELNSKYWKQFPFSAYLDLGAEKHLSSIWFYDTNGQGEVVISGGKPGALAQRSPRTIAEPTWHGRKSNWT